MNNQNLAINLKDGRKLGFSITGDNDGFPIFYLRGTPGSRLQALDFQDIAQTKHCCIYGIDRPGMGLSSPNPKHTILSFVDDLSELAAYLKIDKFSIIAHSGGSAFAVACAYKIPSKLKGVAIVSGLAPTTLLEAKVGMQLGYRIFNKLARNIPGFARFMMSLHKKQISNLKTIEKFCKYLPKPDQIILQDANRITELRKWSLEAFVQGTSGAAQEMRLITNPWNINLADINFPISVWQGKLDKQVPVSHAELFKKYLQNCRLHLLDNESHLSILYNHIGKIIDSVSSVLIIIPISSLQFF